MLIVDAHPADIDAIISFDETETIGNVAILLNRIFS